MKYLQFLATVVCLAILWIALQLSRLAETAKEFRNVSLSGRVQVISTDRDPLVIKRF